MDVTRDNFPAVLDGLLHRINTCEFFAIDLEMTGINVASNPENASMSLQDLYDAKRHVASRFGIIQVGVALFHRKERRSGKPSDARQRLGHCVDYVPELGLPAPPPAAHEYDVRPYNVFVFPAADGRTSADAAPRVGGADGDVVLSPSAVDFLKQHGLDFQRWMYRGVPYVDEARSRTVIEAIRDEREELANPARAVELEALLSATERDWLKAAIQQARALVPAAEESAAGGELQLQAPVPLTAEFALPAVRSANACAALEAAIACDARLREHLEVVVRGRRDNKDAILKRINSLEAAQRQRRVLADKLGFWLIFDALAKSGKPCIAHNSLADWCFLHDAFIGPLPESVNDFAASIRSTVKGDIFDTKYMTAYAPSSVVPLGRFDSTGLGQLYNQYGPATNAVHLNFPEGFHAYHPDAMRRRGGSAAHEAGYDALMTGAVFANVAREFPAVRDVARNRVAVFGSLDCLDLDRAQRSRADPRAAAVRVTRGDVAVVHHSFKPGAAYSMLSNVLPCSTQLVFPIDENRAIVALEGKSAQRFEHHDALVQAVEKAAASSGRGKKSKPLMDVAELRSAVSAAAAAGGGQPTPLSKLRVEPLTPQSFTSETSTSANRTAATSAAGAAASSPASGGCPHGAKLPAILRRTVGAALCAAVRSIRR